MSAGNEGSAGALFLKRAMNLVVRPGSEWKSIKEEQGSSPGRVTRYLAVMAAIPPLSAVAERLLFERGIAGSQPVGLVVATNVLWYFVIIVNMIVTAAVITAIACRKEAGLIAPAGFKLAVYAFTPVFLADILMLFSRSHGIIYVALLYSLYLLYLGIRTLLETEQGRALWHTGVSFGATVVIVGATNTFEYLLESFIATKFQS